MPPKGGRITPLNLGMNDGSFKNTLTGGSSHAHAYVQGVVSKYEKLAGKTFTDKELDKKLGGKKRKRNPKEKELLGLVKELVPLAKGYKKKYEHMKKNCADPEKLKEETEHKLFFAKRAHKYKKQYKAEKKKHV